MADYWRDELLPASLAGEPFFVEQVTGSPGRRNAIQEFPGTAFVRGQDLGPRARRFEIQAYLIGRDYHLKLRRLEAVFDRPGPHVLSHPYRGRMLVHIEGEPSVVESRAKGGFAAVTFRAVKASDDDGRPTTSAADVASAAASATRAAVQASLAASMDLSTTTARATVDAAGASLGEMLSSSVSSALDLLSESGQTVEQAVSGLAQAVALAETPAALLAAVAETVRIAVRAPLTATELLGDAYGELAAWQRLDAVLELARLFVGTDDNGLEPLTPSALVAGSTVDAALAGAQALTAAARAEAATSLAEAVVSTPPESSEQARSALNALEALIVGETDGDPDGLLLAVDVEAMSALADLRAAATRYLLGLASSLPTLSTYTTPSQTNVFLLAQLLLGDAGRWEEIWDRNALADPVLIPAGTAIEYIAPSA